MNTASAALCGYGLDLLLGDPAALTRLHPVVHMGRAIRFLEPRLRSAFPKTERGELAAGTALALSMPIGTYLTSRGLLRFVRNRAPLATFALETIWSWQVLAAKNLRDEAENVRSKLEHDTIESAREAVGRIVGRDTEDLSAPEIARAAVETVAENFSDGVVAPMFYLALGGAPLALTYKAINTMDSMVGYKNKQYLFFGRAGARLDDAANYLPARLSALLLIASAALTGADAKNAWRIWRRDRRAHASPNAGQCEAAAAGALHLRLCGPARYFGAVYDKPYIGDDDRPISLADIDRICRLEHVGSALALALLLMARRLLLR
ncbi:MAG: cobalamin biosynthesis protein CobD [Oscillospiraceae bacterium]|nr:cobalamin biosynthesis protein CobD [Oscillospiraceae bacterium]